MDTNTWILAIVAGVMIAALVAILVGRSATRRREDREEQAAQPGPTPDGPGYEDGDPMPHRPSTPFDAGSTRVGGGRSLPPTAPRVAARRSPTIITDGPLRERAAREGRTYRPGMYDPPRAYPVAEDPTRPGWPYSPQFEPARDVDTPRESSPPEPAPKWGGYEGGGYSDHSSSGSSHSSSHDSGSSGGYSGGSDSGGGSSSGGGGGGE